ncbi:Quinic acid utilization activator [Talaromyces islandicus]|uniref:Quinic acid utilization activator n=1 Tax=Talaromyces islandicus TaxID=28573 RepID=A0A0U1LZY1_TALIS|nr:Quinic acid utilization activator [Talaromyces islandicus]
MTVSRQTLRVPHLGGTTVGFRSSGSVLDPAKPTLVLVIPFTTTVDYYAPEFENSALTSKLNLIAIEPLGHGATRTDSETFTYWDSALVNVQLLEVLGVDRVIAGGTSQGGWIAVQMALLAPQKVQGLVLIGTSMDSESPQSRELGCWDGPAATSGFVKLGADMTTPQHDFEPGQGYYDFLVEIGYGKDLGASLRSFWEETIKTTYRGEEGKRRICMAAINLASRDGLYARLPYVKCPVVWLHGTSDVVFSLANAQEGIKHFVNSPEARLVPFDKGVHFLSFTHPKEVHENILEFTARWSRQGRLGFFPEVPVAPTHPRIPRISTITTSLFACMMKTYAVNNTPSLTHNTANVVASPSPSNPEGHAHKRRRVALACGTCRSRKSRCDGARPKCSLCRELGQECVYQQVGSSPNLTVGKEYVAQLEHRIEQIEEFIRPLREGRAEITPVKSFPLPEENDLYRHHTSTAAGDPSSITGNFSSHQGSHNTNEIGEADTSEDSIDGMAAISFQYEQDAGFFGPSSNIAFMRHISKAISQATYRNPSLLSVPSNDNKHGNEMTNASQPHAHTERIRNKQNPREVNIYALPSEEQSWDLIEQYFSKTGQLLPFIHEQSVRETYFQMKRNDSTKVRRTWLGLLNIIFAIALSLCTDSDMPAQQRIDESDVFYQRANALCDRESRRNASLEMVQYLLVLGQYLQGTQKSVQAWTTHGLAITAAFQLGIHSPEANKAFPALECEIRKRTWFGCVLLDRTLSMTFGRPCIIPQSYIRLELPSVEMQVLGRTPQPETCTHRDGCFFTAAIQLYVVMYNIIDTCYDQNLGLSTSETSYDIVSKVLEGDRQLDEWRHGLVPSLGLHVLQKPLTTRDMDLMKVDSVIFQRFNIVLSLRFHNLRILLHRKFLEKFLDMGGMAGSEAKVPQQVGVNSVHNCVESAIVIISTVHTVATTTGWHRGVLGAWNYSLYYTFNAGLVIFGALLVSSRESPKNPALWEPVERSRPYLDLAVDALRRLDSGNHVIERCVEYLSQIALALAALDSNPTSGNSIPITTLTSNNTSAYPDTIVPSSSHMVPFNTSHHHQQFSLSQSPVSVDLGEFMIDSDFDFLGKVFFDLSHSSNSNNNINNINGSDSRASAVNQPSGLYRG